LKFLLLISYALASGCTALTVLNLFFPDLFAPYKAPSAECTRSSGVSMSSAG
jgi:hypothetical protein